MSQPRAYTADEVRDMLLDKIRDIADYWATIHLKAEEHGFKTPQDELNWRCHGVAFSILATLDGSSPELPGFDLVPTPHEDDRAWAESNGENWFDPEMRLSTTLHEFYHKART